MLESIAGYLQHNAGEIAVRFFDLLSQPFRHGDMVWIIIPVILTIIVMECYYSRHSKEETGWNTATANSLVLIFISMDLFRFLSIRGELSFLQPNSYAFAASLLVLIVLLEGIFMFVMDFSHLWPKFIAFHFTSHLTVNLIAYTSIVLIYGGVPINLATIVAAIIFFIIINILVFVLRFAYAHKRRIIA